MPGVIARNDADTAFWKNAAILKASHAIALADAFCLALARRLSATAVTADHNEFDPLVSLGLCPIRFIRVTAANLIAHCAVRIEVKGFDSLKQVLPVSVSR